MILYLIHKTTFLRKWYFNSLGRPFVKNKLAFIAPLLSPQEKILDLGSGNGLASYLLKENGFLVTPVDIQYGHYHADVKPIVYDGHHLPFQDKSFDTAIILTVLHHVLHPERIIQETSRVCNRIIIMEDIYENKVQQYLTYCVDAAINLFYSPCPHTNKNDKEWLQTFEEMGFELTTVQYRNVFFIFKQAIYEIRQKQSFTEK